MPKPACYSDVDQCVAAIIDSVGNRIVLGLPLGIGKPAHLVNALFRRACADAGLSLTIVTALSLQPPRGSNLLEERFLAPLRRRLYAGHPELEYGAALRSGRLPANVEILEFYARPGAWLGVPRAQRNMLNSNYTHVVRDLTALGVNVVVQSVARTMTGGNLYYSLACNPDITPDLLPALRADKSRKVLVVGQVNSRLPFMGAASRLPPEFFDAIVAGEACDHEPFGTINMPVDGVEHMIGLYASCLVRDGGTLQLGIGEIADAVAHSLNLRHSDNAAYRRILRAVAAGEKFGETIAACGGEGIFDRGLYGLTEMLGDALWFLYRRGILKRRVYPHAGVQRLLDEGLIGDHLGEKSWQHLLDAGVGPRLGENEFEILRDIGVFTADADYRDGFMTARGTQAPADLDRNRDFFIRNCLGEKLENGSVIHAAFCLGSAAFYDALRALDAAPADIGMCPVSFTNELYGDDYFLKRAQRRHARFINSGLKATLNGGIVSDRLENGQVVSGVGGQYNFVAMAHALPEARSILTVRSTRGSGSSLESNIVWSYGGITIPAHLRDIVITEYGIADLRGKTDEEVIIALLKISDSRFQQGLLRTAQRSGKLRRDYRLPAAFRDNHPEAIERTLAGVRAHFPEYPVGTDFTAEERVLLPALENLKALSKDRLALFKALVRAARLRNIPERLEPCLQRMRLERPRGLRERAWRRLLAQQLLELERLKQESAASSGNNHY